MESKTRSIVVSETHLRLGPPRRYVPVDYQTPPYGLMTVGHLPCEDPAVERLTARRDGEGIRVDVKESSDQR
jgi:hypothetical protein